MGEQEKNGEIKALNEQYINMKQLLKKLNLSEASGSGTKRCLKNPELGKLVIVKKPRVEGEAPTYEVKPQVSIHHDATVFPPTPSPPRYDLHKSFEASK